VSSSGSGANDDFPNAEGDLPEEEHGSPGEAGGGALWGGRFKGGLDPAMVPLNASLAVDIRLLPQDLRGSRVWARALGRAGALTEEEVLQIVEGLDRVGRRLARTSAAAVPPAGATDEDVHSLVERLLREEIGPVAGKLHTGRSRNDQVATDFRLWGMEAATQLRGHLGDLMDSLIGLAERSMDVVLPGYTHLQQGQPVRGSHWALSHVWALLRDRERLERAGAAAGVLPLGSGAIAGCPFPVDREWMAGELGFGAVTENSMDAVADRDWAAELSFACALLGVHLSRLAEDLVLFTSLEFGFLALPEGFTTGSSLMPQKRNPDVAELTRGKSGRLLGNLTALLTLLKGLPSGYNRDLQEDKESVFDSVDTLMLVLPALAGTASAARFTPERIRMDAGLLATDLADILVEAGVPFRESHEVVGALVRAAEEQGVSLVDLPADLLSDAHPALAGIDLSGLTFEGSVERRVARGGTARQAVLDQLARARSALNRGP
jgi:argininosuccinate lyase